MKKYLIIFATAAIVASPALAQEGKLGQTRTAVSVAAERRFHKIDADGNGGISAAEFTAFAQKRGEKSDKFNPRRAAKMFAKNDANGDGSVTLDEYKARALAMFDARDLNKNGTIDANEVPAAAPASEAAPTDQ